MDRIPFNAYNKYALISVGTCNFGNIVHFSQFKAMYPSEQNIPFALSFACGANVQTMRASARHH